MKKKELLKKYDELMINIIKDFLINSEETGKHIVTSLRTGKKYYVEPIGNGRSDWGDVDPATGNITGSYGSKYTGSVTELDSVIKKENGFKTVVTIKGGSPYGIIQDLDKKYPDLVNI